MELHYTNDAKGKIEEALISEELQRKAGSYPETEVVHLKRDGNVTRQILGAVEHETLETYFAKEDELR